METSNCEYCLYNVYDEAYGCYECQAAMDEDDMIRFIHGSSKGCPYYQLNDEYKIVRKQM